MFAIVDIETTGLQNGENRITEIAVVLHNGHTIEGKYCSLVNPQMPIQKYVQTLTGITDRMVQQAPLFSAIAPHIFHLLENRIFVAHNVNFDFTIVKEALKQCGYELKQPRLCTIRLAKKIYPGLPKYGLSSLCKSLNIPFEGHHRALADAVATAEIFTLLFNNDTDGELKKMVKKKPETYLPPLIDAQLVNTIPQKPGIYFFHHQSKIIYVGKAINLQKRVKSHFTGRKSAKLKQRLIDLVDNITYEETPNSWVASIRESIEIKKRWPEFNKSQKFFEHQFAIVSFLDKRGYLRLAIDKYRKNIPFIRCFHLFTEAHNQLWQWVKNYQLDPSLCFLDYSVSAQQTVLPHPDLYNQKVKVCIQQITETNLHALIDMDKKYYVLVKHNQIAATGFIHQPLNFSEYSADQLLTYLHPCHSNQVAMSVIEQYITQFPNRLIAIA